MKAVCARLKHLYEFGPFRIDADERALRKNGCPVPLSPKAFETLLLLVENSGRLIAKEELITRIWPDTFVEEANLANNVSLLRRVLGSDDDHPYIETVPRRGYRFSAPVRELWDEMSPPESRRGLRLVNGSQSASVRSIAVLPFKWFGAGGDDYVGTGIADALITRLGNLKHLLVRPTSSIRRYSAPEQDAVSAGKELKVDAVLEGSVRTIDGQYRVTVQLVSVQDQSPIWSEKFEGSDTNLLSMEDSISDHIASVLSSRLSSEQHNLSNKRYTYSSDPYQSYLKGRYHLNRWTREGFISSIEHFRESIGKDSRFTLGYCGLADAYRLLAVNGCLPISEAMPRAEFAASTALEIDSQLADAHLSAGAIEFFYRWQFTEARRLLERSIDLNGNLSAAYDMYSRYLIATGRLQEGWDVIKEAQQMDPLCLAISVTMAEILCIAGQYEMAIERCVDTLDIKPKFYPAFEQLGDAYQQMGMYDRAVDVLMRGVTLSKRATVPLARLCCAYVASGNIPEATSILSDLQVRSNKDYVLAWVYTQMGEGDLAFETLHRAYQMRDPQIVYLKVDPKLDALRCDHRMNELIDKMGFEPIHQ